MKLVRSKAFWMSLATGSAVTVAVLAMRRKARSRRPAPQGYRTRVTGDSSQRVAWRFDRQFHTLPAGNTLRIEVHSPAVVHWTANQWDSVEDTHTTEIAAGVHVADLATESLAPGTRVQITFYWPEVNRWEGEDFELTIEAAAGETVRAARGDHD